MTDLAVFTETFGDERAQFAYFIAMAVFFTLLSIGIYVLLCVETSFHQEIRTGFNKPLTLMKKSKGGFIAFAIWFICVSWLYNYSLGTKFVEVQRKVNGKAVVWEFTYHYPTRVVPVPEEDINRWTGAVDWSRKTGQHALVVELKNGTVLKSGGMAPPVFKEKADKLARYGITIPWGSGQ